MGNDRLTRLARIYQMQRTGEARRIRQAAGISASELGRALGTQPKSMLRWEAGEVRPRPDTALQWLAALEQLAEITDQDNDQEEALAAVSA